MHSDSLLQQVLPLTSGVQSQTKAPAVSDNDIHVFSQFATIPLIREVHSVLLSSYPSSQAPFLTIPHGMGHPCGSQLSEA
jgi:hypothetical protein